MEDLLFCKDMYVPLLGNAAKPKEMKDEDWMKLDRNTVGFIRQWLENSIFHYVSTESSAYSLWQKLESLYERKTTDNKSFFIWKLINLKYKEGSSIAEHLNELQSITN